AGAYTDVTEASRMQAALAESEHHHRSILDHAPLGIHELDGAGCFLTINAAGLRRCHARTLDEIRGRSFLDFVHPDERKGIGDLLGQAARGVPARFEFRSTGTPGGTDPVCESCFIPLPDAEGRAGRIIGITHDITHRVRADEQRRESEFRFRIIADHISEVFWLDRADGSTVFANQAFEKIWGSSVEELCADHSLWIRSVHPDDRTHVLERYGRIEEAGQDEYEYRIRRADGAVRWIHERAVAVRDHHGEINFIAGTSIDITARKQAEAERESARRHIAHLLETADAVLASTDEQQAIEHIAEGVHGAGWNGVVVTLYDQWRVTRSSTRGLDAAAVAHFTAHRPTMRRRAQMFGPDFEPFRIGRSWLVPGARDRINDDSILAFEAGALPATGAWRDDDLAYIPLRRPGGGVLGSICISQPVDGRRPDVETLRPLEFFADLAGRVIDAIDAERRQTRLMRELNHRVRNNLGIVLALSQLTRESASSLAEFAANFEGRILTLARTHEALARNDWKGADLHELLVLMLGPHAAQVDLDGRHLNIDADVISPLCMVIHELTTNAVKHGALSTSAGRVAVRWGESAVCRVELEWIESGGPEVHPPTRNGHGTGLIKGFIEHDLSGVYESRFDPEGFRIRLEVPHRRPVIMT
ncbi:MAG: PAS domain S-box protein, partial [Phycisphaerales bacterium]|nr:PAS domain S-box protein [Phycisphaerales bacterium]